MACPFCNNMRTDGMNERDKEDDLDIAEVGVGSLVPARSLVRHRGDEAEREPGYWGAPAPRPSGEAAG